MKNYLSLLLVILLSHSCFAQSCLTNSLIINTGYNPITGLAITPGADGTPGVTDPKWTVTSISPDVASAIAMTPITGLVEVTPGNNADVITTVSGIWVLNPFGNPGGWISCLNSKQFYDNAADTAVWNMELTRQFRMCNDDSIVLNINIANDNYISAMYIDGILLPFSQPPVGLVSNFTMFTNFIQTIGLTAGTHTLNVVVNNKTVVPPAQENPMGLDIYGTVSSASGTASLVSENTSACAAYICDATGGCNSIALPDTLHTCSGNTDTLHATLSGTDSVLSISWSPAIGLSDTDILNPALTTSTPGWYYLTVQSLIPGNLVVNGDFSAGNTGFSSSYSYVSGYGSLVPASVYAITTDPHLDHPTAASFGDHTTGTGNMMAINGASTPIDVWCETIAVIPNTNYAFSAWFANWSSDTSDNFPILQFEINGVLTGPVFSFPHPDGLWTEFYTTWNSGTNTSVSICINDQQTAATGNDFSVDDISFQQICTTKDSIYIAIGSPDTTYSHKDTSACAGATGIVLRAPAGYAAQTWNTGATTDSIVISTTGSYWVTETGSCSLLTDTFHVAITTMPSVNIGNDTAICQGSVIALSSSLQPAGSSYLWSNGSIAATITVNATGTYWLSVTDGGCSAADSVTVTVYPIPSVDLGPDLSVCQGQSVTLQSADAYTGSPTYLWNTGSSSSQVTPLTSGTYWLQVTENNCTSADTVDVDIKPLPVVNLGNDTTICSGSSSTIAVSGSAGTTYLWGNGSSSSSINVSDSGTYSVTVTDSGCTASGSIHIAELLPPSINLGPDTLLCSGQEITLLTNTDAASYLWSDGSNGQSLLVSQSGTYWAIVSNQCGSAADSVKVTYDMCDIWFPSAFTPNGDNLNDIARVRGSLNEYTNFSLSIFNRFGQLVFYTQDIYDGWNGTFNGTKQDVGTYFYLIYYTLQGKQNMMRGDLTLIR